METNSYLFLKKRLIEVLNMDMIEFIKTNKIKWNKKEELNVGDNKLYRIIGIGPKAFKVLWFGPTPGTKHPVWNQCWWNYNDLDEIAEKVVAKMYSKMSGQSTL